MSNTRLPYSFKITLFILNKIRTKEIVKTIHSDPKQQYRHPHPQLNATGNRLLFIENSDTDGTLGSITLRTLA